VIDRASPTDLAFLAMDIGTLPQQFGVILLLEQVDAFDLAHAQRLIAERIPAVPRLRQQLIRVPFGCGGPIWVDDSGFDIRTHVRTMACRAPGDERALLDSVLSVIATPLPGNAPLWSAVFLTGLTDDKVALVLVVHHVLSDGVGGLAVLAHLVDQGAGALANVSFPRSRPTAGMLALDASRRRLRAVRRVWSTSRLLRTSMRAGGGLHPPRAAPCSLMQRTGSRRSLAVVPADVARIREAAHQYEATVNDAVLVAVAGALYRVLSARGEFVNTFAIGVPVSGRSADRSTLGNMVSPLLVHVPSTGDVAQRLAWVASQVRMHKASATGPPPIALLGWIFRLLAALGGYRWYMNHQHRLHTLVSHVRGPRELITFGGCPVSSVVPVSVAEGGNMPAYFAVFSYAGTVTITAIVDPDHFPDLDTLIDGLRAELDLITNTPAIDGERRSDDERT
jgi:diacylglycerol O-acyltransferase / wax synthase